MTCAKRKSEALKQVKVTGQTGYARAERSITIATHRGSAGGGECHAGSAALLPTCTCTA